MAAKLYFLKITICSFIIKLYLFQNISFAQSIFLNIFLMISKAYICQNNIFDNDFEISYFMRNDLFLNKIHYEFQRRLYQSHAILVSNQEISRILLASSSIIQTECIPHQIYKRTTPDCSLRYQSKKEVTIQSKQISLKYKSNTKPERPKNEGLGSLDQVQS